MRAVSLGPFLGLAVDAFERLQLRRADGPTAKVDTSSMYPTASLSSVLQSVLMEKD